MPKLEFGSSHQRVLNDLVFMVSQLEAKIKSQQEEIRVATDDFNYRMALSDNRWKGMEREMLETDAENEHRFDELEERIGGLEGEDGLEGKDVGLEGENGLDGEDGLEGEDVGLEN